ncbi:hypothetical protein TVAG_207310 [Trichomonas vaginalis G3]|uniref:Uncharacterized protein n=1 Tax=Trichomonas vaginalis (strain ATCC PRA-98 / G3) TaxID=412133 RepID=A2G474_TRIV3|nr:hypothetical protein TVAGG3_0821690 [Trichomonas vaginalis G3]EAX88046.1 hypothetical protein TVAG_207310 [Trichomonas vaginalis G3]KAI5497942.1 hypothetical protein TVAGG3_0821690 [Trichomonas vaginalis G3]|eukprot:XP_001300976.1 hypothetical protein [Trichomonas vaginalis G3]
MKSNEVAAFVDSFAQNPAQDIPAEFLDQLKKYSSYVEEFDIVTITNQYNFIPKNVEKILSNPYLCSEMQVCDLITDILFKFITARNNPGDQPSLWAANLLRKLGSQQSKLHSLFGLPGNLVIKAVMHYPREYMQSITDEALSTIALSSPPKNLIPYLLEELEKRKLEIPPQLIMCIDIASPNISPALMISIFNIYINAPTIQFAEQLVSAIKIRPQIHIMFISDLSMYNISNLKNSLEILGSVISQQNFDFPLSCLYSPVIQDIADEIQYTYKSITSTQLEFISQTLKEFTNDQIPFLFPLVLEFPLLGKAILDIDERVRELFSL